MKTIINFLGKVVLVLVLSTSLTLLLNYNGVKLYNEAHAAVTEAQVYNYLVNRGYTVVTLQKETSLDGQKNYNWIAHTIKSGIHYWTTVYCDANNIIGHGDSPF